MNTINNTQHLFSNLMNLVRDGADAFFFKDFELNSRVYRIFNYRLASYTQFQLADAKNCRGTMFDVTDASNPLLVSLPPEKFFNYEEGAVDHNTDKRLGDIMVKMDGSLISTYTHESQLMLKSKGSLFSSQAVDATKLLAMPSFVDLANNLSVLANEGFTVNLEYTAPHNRIVIPYQQEALTVLSVRRHADGRNFFASSLMKEFLSSFPSLEPHLVEFRNEELTPDYFVEKSRDEQEGEGYVVEIIPVDGSSPYLIKAKNTRYSTLHHTKDSVNSDRRLFDAIIEEASDDLRGMFADDVWVLNRVAEMENKVMPVFNKIVATVEDFVTANKSLIRKDFAILAKQQHPELMSLMMNIYLERENDYREFAKKHRKDIFGIGDIEVDRDE